MKSLLTSRKLYAETKPIEGTKAKQYLRQARGIEGDLPSSLRYLLEGISLTYQGKTPKTFYGALVSVGTNPSQEIRALQLTYLNQQGERALGKQGEKRPKKLFEIQKGSFVEVQTGQKRLAFVFSRRR